MSSNQVLKNSFFYIIPIVVGSLVPIVTLPIFTRTFTPVEFGILTLAQVYAIFMNGISNFGLITGFERNFFESNENSKRISLLYSIVLFVIIFSFIFLIITLAIENFVLNNIFKIYGYKYILVLSYLTTAISSLKLYFLSYFKNTEDAKSFALYSTDETIFSILFSLIFVFCFKLNIYGFVVGQLISALLVFGLLVIKFKRINPISFDFDSFKSALKISLPLTPKVFFGILNNQIDKYLIGILSSIGGVGVYNIAQKVANSTFTLMTAIQNVFSPKVYRLMFEMESKRAGKYIGLYLTPFYYVSIFFSLLVSLFSEELIFILYPPAYYDAINITSVFTMLYASYFFSKHPQIIYSKKTWLSSLLFIISIILNVVIGIPFTKTWGPIGTAWGTVFSGFIWGILYFYISQKCFYIEWEKKKIFIISGIFIFSTIFLILLRYFQVDYLYKISFKFFSLFSFIYFGFYFKIILKAYIKRVTQILPIKF